MKKISWKIIIATLLVAIASINAEKAIPGRFFSRPIFQRQEEAAQAANGGGYPPSGWKPTGNRLLLSARQEEPIPHTVYGPPSSETPANEYGPPATDNPTNEYGPPDNEYGSPSVPQEPNNAYGPPDAQQPEPLEPQDGYAPAGPPGESANAGYNYPPPETLFPEPGHEYGPPQQPANEYGPPEQPTNEYGPPQQPETGYGAPEAYNPPQGNGQIPVEQGASERLRQQQFIQQLPSFQPSRFLKLQRQRQQSRRKPAVAEKLQQLPQQNKPQHFQRIQRPVVRQPQQQRAQTPQFAQNQQLYQTPPQSAEPDEPNIAVATAVSGEYYVIEPNGRLQRVSYTTKNGKLLNGKITSGIKNDNIHKINAPIYRVNELNQLIRVNREIPYY